MERHMLRSNGVRAPPPHRKMRVHPPRQWRTMRVLHRPKMRVRLQKETRVHRPRLELIMPKLFQEWIAALYMYSRSKRRNPVAVHPRTI